MGFCAAQPSRDPLAGADLTYAEVWSHGSA